MSRINKLFMHMSRSYPVLSELLLRVNATPMIFGPRYASRFRGYWETDSESRLLAVLESALRDVPFYARRYKGARIASVADFKAAFGTIDKDTVLGDYEAFASTAMDRSRYDECTTGGTSGKPLRLLLPRDRYVHEYAALHRMWGKVGYRFSPKAVVRNERIDGRDFVINPVLREYVFDGFRSSEDYLERIYEVMKQRRIGFYHGYTSNAHEFARFLVRRGLDYSFLKAFITTSENFYPHQKAAFDAIPGVRHLNFYGHSEKLVLAEYCSASGLYHFHQQYGFCELLDEAGRDVTSIGEIGEIVGSTLYNIGMPLLRYRTGDRARYAGTGQCMHCGHQGMSATEILGRWAGDRVYNADGTYVTTTALNLHSDLYASIDGLQYVQDLPGRLLVRVVPGSGYDVGIAARLRADIVAKMAQTTDVRVEEVGELEKTANGKFLLFISRRGRAVVS